MAPAAAKRDALAPVSLLLLLPLLLLTACAPQPRHVLAAGHEGAPGVARFVVCAPNIAVPLAPELEKGIGALQQEVEAYLTSQGREVERIDRREGRLLWRRAIAQAKEEGAIEDTAKIFASELGKHVTFQAIVMPSILLHKTRVTASTGRWDGVKRRLRMRKATARGTGGREQDTSADGAAFGGVSGEVAATSVHVLVFSREGERIFEGRGGIEFVHDLDMSNARRSGRTAFAVREDLFQDRAALQEGVAIAFTPYLPPVGASGDER